MLEFDHSEGSYAVLAEGIREPTFKNMGLKQGQRQMLHLGKAQDRTGSLVSRGTFRDAR